MNQIKSGIYYEDVYIGVTLGAMVHPHGIVYVDAPLRSEDARAWRTALLNQRGGVNRLLVCLDSHIDRTLGARAMDCTIMAHQKSAQTFRNRPTVFKGDTLETGAEWEAYGDSIGTRWAAPDMTFSKQVALHWGGPEIIVEHHPGSAPGASWVIDHEEKVVFVGDTILVNQPPFLAKADLNAWLEALGVLLTEFHDYTIVSGRGGPIPIESVRTFQRVLKNILKGMLRLAKRNASPENTEKLVPGILDDLAIPGDSSEYFATRLRHGLFQYYMRHYRVSIATSQTELEDKNYS